MSEIQIRGYSDEVIDVQGAGLDDEYDCCDYRHLTFSDGTVLRIEYDPPEYEGKWKIERIKEGAAQYQHRPALDDKSDSDVVFLTGDIRSMECWRDLEPSKEELIERITHGADYDWWDLSVSQLKRVYEIVCEIRTHTTGD